VIRQGGQGGLDLLAVQRDDDLLDLLGARRPVAEGDEVARLLASLAAAVDDALPASVATIPLTPAPAASSSRQGRRLGAAGVAAAVLVGGSVALSGAAAAVMGDPLAPYKTVGHAAEHVGSAVGDALSLGGDDLPEQAAPVAHLNKRLAGARAALAHGDTAEVRALVDELTAVLATADLSDEQRAALQKRLDQLEDSLARAKPSRDATAPKNGGKVAEKGSADNAPADRAPADNAPADRAPADKAPADRAPADSAPADQAPADQTTDDAVDDATDQQAPTPAPRTTTHPTGGGQSGTDQSTDGDSGASGSQQSLELGSDATDQQGRGGSRR
jgi:hypothetical protein